MELLSAGIDRQVSAIKEMVGVEEIDLESFGARRLTPLHYAAWYNNIEAVERLLELGSDPNERDRDDATALHYVARYKHRVPPTGTPVLLDLSASSPYLVIHALLNAGADLNAKDRGGASPLFNAVMRGNEQAVEVLLDLDNINVRGDLDNRGWSPLHIAAKYNRENIAIHLLRGGVLVTAQDHQKYTPLHVAAGEGHDELLRVLIEKEKDNKIQNINAENNRRETPLHLAAENRFYKCVKLCIEHGAELRRTCRDSYVTALHLVAMVGGPRSARMLLEADPKLAFIRSADQATPLHRAAQFDKHMVAQVILEYYAKLDEGLMENGGKPDIEVVDGGGMMPVFPVALDGGDHIEAGDGGGMMPVLPVPLGGGDHIEAGEGDGMMPLLAPALDGSDDIKAGLGLGMIPLLPPATKRNIHVEARDCDGMTPLLLAVANGSNGVLKLLLKKGANCGCLNKRDQTAIHLAAKNNLPETLKILIDHMKKQYVLEMQISADDRTGNTPLHLAAEEGFQAVVQMLLAHGADLANKNENEETPLHMAAKNGRTGSVRVILKHAGEVEEEKSLGIILDRDEDGNTPLHLAASNGHTHVVESLLASDGETNFTNGHLWTPAFCAAIGGHTQTLQVILKAGADINITDRFENTALMEASKEGHKSAVKLLLKFGAKIDAHDANGYTAMDKAIHYGHKDVVAVLLESEDWRQALRTRVKKPETYHSTPLRRLIKHMPEMAEVVLDKCVTQTEGVRLHSSDMTLTFDLEFLDDTYTATSWGMPRLLRKISNHTLKTPFDQNDNLRPAVKCYTDDSDEKIYNHPLNIMVRYKRNDLLYHPLSLMLIRHKWRVAQISFFGFLIYYGIFLSFLTSYLTTSTPPYMVNSSLLTPEGVSACQTKLAEDFFIIAPGRENVAAIIIWMLASFGILVELLQWFQNKLGYFTHGTNLLDWFTYVAACLLVLPLDPCGIRKVWQWQLGVACMFIAWINFILFLRRVPSIGLYIVMVGEVTVTFTKFFIFCFSLFLFAFGFVFFALFRNQAQFATGGYAMVKMVVMMIGELDYVDMFHSEGEDELHYEVISYLVYILFVSMVTIVIMNLLTGLAVGDVQAVQELAELKKMALQVDLALDVEWSMPDRLRRRLKVDAPKLYLEPNAHKSANLLVRCQDYWAGPLSGKQIAKAVLRETMEEIEEKRAQREEKEGGRKDNALYQKVISQVKDNQQQMRSAHVKLARIEAMLAALIKQNDIKLEASDHEMGKSD